MYSEGQAISFFGVELMLCIISSFVVSVVQKCK